MSLMQRKDLIIVAVMAGFGFLLLVLLILVNSSTPEFPNIARNKPVYASSVYDKRLSPENIVDGLESTAFETLNGQREYLVVDLGLPSTIMGVRVIEKLWFRAGPFNVLIGDSYVNADSLKSYRICAEVDSEHKVFHNLTCNGFGRFVAIQKKAKIKESLRYLNVKELMVFGITRPGGSYAARDWIDDQSLAYGKPAYMLSSNTNLQYFEFTDGNAHKNKKVPGTNRPWIVIDLKSTVQFEVIRLFGLEGSAVATGIDVVLGTDWLPCRSDKLTLFVTCATIWKPKQFIEIECVHYEARFAGLRSRGNGNLYLKEFKVFSSQLPQPLVARTDEWRSLLCNFNQMKKYNIAARKKVWVSATQNNASFLTDGKPKTCVYTGYNGWFVIDLRTVHKIQAVSFFGIHQWWRKATKNIEIRVLKFFDPCRPHFEPGISCTPVPDGMDPTPYVVDCSVTGQFVALRKTKNDREKLALCEVMVVGTLQAHLRPVMPVERPVISDWIAKPDMELRNSLLAGVATIHIPRYAMRILVAPQSATPLFVKPSSRFCVLAASVVGKGRVVVAGERAFLWLIESNKALIWSRLRTWLAQGAMPHIHKANQVVSKSPFETPGGIILWTVSFKVSTSSKTLILQLLRSGKASVVVGDRAHNVSPFFAPYQDVLDQAGIQLMDQYANEGPTDWVTTGFNDSNVVSLQQQLEYALASTEFYLSHGTELVNDINQLSAPMLQLIHAKSKLSRLADIYEPYMNSVEPCVRRPTTSSQEKLYNTVFAKLMVCRGLADTNRPVATAKLFPGYPGHGAAEETVKIKFVATQSNEAHATGLYLPPGKTLRMKVVSKRMEATSWYVRVGCHTDDIHKRPSWSRYRTIVTDQLPVLIGDVFSGFGGVVWITNTKSNTNITLELSGAIRAPYFNMRDPKNMKEWDKRGRQYQAPWAEVAGDKFVFCVPSSSVRKYDRNYLADLMTNTWDLAVKGNFWLALNQWRKRRRERMTVDVQISVGWGHSGYPIQAYLAWVPEMVDKQYIKENGAWGMSHELGHNLQNGRWTFGPVGEVTNNIFTLYDIYLWGNNFFKFDNKSLNQARAHLNSGATYKSWTSNSFVALRVYQQTAHHFGWEAYNSVFLRYIKEDIKPKSNEDKRNAWVTVWSDVVEMNLCPMYEFWGYLISEKTKAALKTKYKAFLPDDILTQQSPTRVAKMLTLYPNAKRKSSKVGMNPAVREKVKGFTKVVLPNDVIYL